MKTQKLLSIAVTCLFIIGIVIPMQAQKNKKPNIVFINMDNFGYGELGVYVEELRVVRLTLRIDKLASEGMRLTNFNVEAQCTPSRAALMTGRYAVRTGNGTVNWNAGVMVNSMGIYHARNAFGYWLCYSHVW